MNSRITRDVDWSEVVFDLNQNIAFRSTQCLRNIWIDPQSDLRVVASPFNPLAIRRASSSNS